MLKQEKTQYNFIEIPPYTKFPWVYDSYIIPKKKIIASMNNTSQTYSLEKIKKGKLLAGYPVEVIVDNVTRILTIGESPLPSKLN